MRCQPRGRPYTDSAQHLQRQKARDQESTRDERKHQEKDDLKRFKRSFGRIDPGGNTESDHAGHTKQRRDDFYCSRHPEEMVDAFGFVGNRGGTWIWFEIVRQEEYSEIADEFVRACTVGQPGRGGMSGRKPTFLLLQTSTPWP